MEKKQMISLKSPYIDYEVGDILNLFQRNDNQNFDDAALIYAHFFPSTSSQNHKSISPLMASDGFSIPEIFSKNHLSLQKVNPNARGSKNIDMLYSIDSIKDDFIDFKTILLEESEVELKE